MERDFLKDLLAIPTAPYRESLVMTFLQNELRTAGVPYFVDAVGNTVVGADSSESYQSLVNRAPKEEPVRVFIAHTDHPGFHGLRFTKKGTLEFKWFGGAPTQKLVGAKVWLADPTGYVGEGTITKAKLTKSKLSIDSGEIKFKDKNFATAYPAESLYGGFGFRKPVWNAGDLHYTKAADDLVGAGVITSLAKTLFAGGPSQTPFLGILTRAEEVGFIGCIGHFDLGWLRPDKVVCVSLETSRTLPGAHIGKGPVVRLGDRANVFDPGCVQVMTSVAQSTLPKKFQRRLMDGGTCEATVAVSYGYPAMGISIPLGNYHNQSFEGGPDSRGKLGPAPEFVSWKDVQGMFALCLGLLQPGLPWQEPLYTKKVDLKKRYEEARPLLETR